jgi:hypothetical protein
MNGNYCRKGWKIGFFAVGAFLLMGLAVMLLWNCLMPELFGTPEILYPQSLGLLVLARILFGGFRGGWCGGHRGCHSGKHSWKEKMKARYEAMSPEEKEKFKAKMGRCGYDFEDEKREE